MEEQIVLACLNHPVAISAYKAMLAQHIPPDGYLWYMNMIGSNCYNVGLIIIDLLVEVGFFMSI